MDLLSRLNRSRCAAFLVFAAIFLLLLFCTHETDLVADDYRYCFSYADGSRITSVAQIFPSMAAHRLSMNGRVIAHFLVQLFLIPPKTLFDLVNALVFTALVWLICRLALRGAKPDALLPLTVFGCLWCLQPDFGQVFLWLDGAINYLWAAALCLLWLLPWSKRFLTGADPSKSRQTLLVLFSFPVGAYSENATVALTAMALCFLALELFERRRPPLWSLLSLLSLLAGFFYMMLAPAESVNKSAEMQFSVLLQNFVETGRFYLRFWPLLLGFVLLYLLSVRAETDRRVRLLSLAFLFGSISGHFVLTFAMYTAARSTYIGLILLLCADALLFAALREAGSRLIPALLAFVCLVCTAWLVMVGVKDILRTHAMLRYNEELIVACAAQGERTVQVPRPYPETDYSAMAGLAYLNTEDPNDWPNVYMARYYGVDMIIGY